MLLKPLSVWKVLSQNVTFPRRSSLPKQTLILKKLVQKSAIVTLARRQVKVTEWVRRWRSKLG